VRTCGPLSGAVCYEAVLATGMVFCYTRHVMKRIVLLLLLTGSLWADSGVVPAEQIAKKWKRTKSINGPTEKIRKGLEVEVTSGGQTVEVKVDADTALSFQNIQFQRDSAQLLDGVTAAQIAEIARAMKQAGSERFLIEGHTCDLGSDAHNLGLSQQRALAVKRALEWHGVESDRLQILGFGETDPVTANTDETARAKNRRVQIYRKL
jgi:outer membrane protein OmpA-like peptidoglycan-associated protein